MEAWVGTEDTNPKVTAQNTGHEGNGCLSGDARSDLRRTRERLEKRPVLKGHGVHFLKRLFSRSTGVTGHDSSRKYHRAIAECFWVSGTVRTGSYGLSHFPLPPTRPTAAATA